MTVSAILLDAGGVLLFPQPDLMLPPLAAAGVAPDLAALERAHYWTMSVQDRPDGPEPAKDTWWRGYLLEYIASCGMAEGGREALAVQMAEAIRGFGWTHVGPAVNAALREIAGLGVPLGVVSNSDGTVQAELHRLGVCSVSDGAGVQVGVVIDSAVVGIAKPDPEIFRIALKALGLPADETVLHVGDSLRYDVAGALAAGIRPVHLDPYGFCPAPEGHTHITSLADLPRLVARALSLRRNRWADAKLRRHALVQDARPHAARRPGRRRGAQPPPAAPRGLRPAADGRPLLAAAARPAGTA